MKDFDLKHLQQVELDMFKDVAHFCDQNDIVYFMDSGTLLGAVRHGGFIPWDDDIDICMDLKNYKKFCRLAPKGLPDKYFVQNWRTDPKVGIRWTRVRINGTTSMERNLTGYDIHYGICMDIFARVGRADTDFGKKLQDFADKWLSTFLVKHYCTALGAELPHKLTLLYRYIPEWLRLAAVSLLERLVFLNTSKKKECYSTWSGPGMAKIFPSTMFADDNRVKLAFEDDMFWAPADNIRYLELNYGDWKTPPASSERNGHGDIIVDFENDYRKYYTG